MPNPVDVIFLRDVQHGGTPDQLTKVAAALADFVHGAQTSVDVAIYDFRLDDQDAVSTVVGALRDAAQRGVRVRIGYDAGKPAAANQATFSVWEADPAPVGTAQWVTEHFSDTAVQTAAITGGHQLMHSKYIVRDPQGDSAAVWTGSTNFTDAAWTRQENNVITIADAAAARAYQDDFDQLWARDTIGGTGRGGGGDEQLGAGTLGWDFCPGDGQAVNTALAQRITDAQRRIVIGGMVITSPEVLTALAGAIDRGVPVSGIYDGGQMDPIVRRWNKNVHDTDLVKAWTTVSAKLKAKRSAPYTATGPHDFMHLKVLVSDDVLTTGSYNFSRNAEKNAENQIHLTDPATVDAYVTYLDSVVAAYP